MKSMKALLVATCCTLMFGCAPKQSTVKQAPAPKHEFTPSKQDEQFLIGQLFYAKMDSVGSLMLCTQPGFLRCFAQTQEQCVAEADTFKSKCMDYSKSQVAVIDSRESAGEFGGKFAMCMGVKHLALHMDRQPEISACLKEFGPDQEIMNRLMTGQK